MTYPGQDVDLSVSIDLQYQSQTFPLTSFGILLYTLYRRRLLNVFCINPRDVCSNVPPLMWFLLVEGHNRRSNTTSLEYYRRLIVKEQNSNGFCFLVPSNNSSLRSQIGCNNLLYVVRVELLHGIWDPNFDAYNELDFVLLRELSYNSVVFRCVLLCLFGGHDLSHQVFKL